MEPAEAVETAEIALRSIVRQILAERWRGRVTEAQLAEAKRRRVEEGLSRIGAQPTDDLLAYIDIPILTGIILKDWSLFKDVFGRNRDRAKVTFNAFNLYRRRSAHTRPMLEFERELLSGIAGMIRNQVSIWQQSQEGPNFYPRIESLETPWGEVEIGYVSAYGRSPLPIVEVGQTVSIQAKGWDPRGRALEWHAGVHRGRYSSHRRAPDFSPAGNKFTFNWLVREEDVGPEVTVYVYLRHTGKYHRSEELIVGGAFPYDFLQTIPFQVAPPQDGT